MPNSSSESIDPVWESRYRSNPAYRNHYPWSNVVSFVFRNRPRNKTPQETGILEVGCGNGSNLWFAAREGFRVAGIDGAETAIEYARKWFDKEKLQGDLRVGDMSQLSFADESFDLVIDRAAISHLGSKAAQSTINEINRVLVPGGVFLFTPYSDRCTSYDGLPDSDGCYPRVTHGSINPGSRVRFYGITDVRLLFKDSWEILSLSHHEEVTITGPQCVHAEWMVVAKKVS